MHTSDLDIDQLKSMIEEKIQHTYLNKYIKNPVIDEKKLFALYTVFNNADMSTFGKEQYIITIMLVQIALDTHEQVPATNQEQQDEGERVAKQLTVLAGDYYSGLYYLILSEMQAFEMIHILASAIKEINEYKMQLYYNETLSLQRYIHDLKKIESLLIQHAAAYVNESRLNPLIEDWLITINLMQRKKHNSKEFALQLRNRLNHLENDSDNLIWTELENIIQKNTNRIEEAVTRVPKRHAMFRNHIQKSLKEVADYRASIAEEG